MLDTSITWSRRAFCTLLLGTIMVGCKPKEDWRLIDVEQMYPSLDFQMVNARTGERVTAQDYLGKIVILFFGYTFCPEICPTTLLTLTSVLEEQKELKSEVAVLFVTVDPDRDTVEALSQYVSSFSPNVIPLTGTPNELAVLARHYRVAYTINPGSQPEDYTVDHTATVFIFARDGRLRLLAPYGTGNEDLSHDLVLLAADTNLG